MENNKKINGFRGMNVPAGWEVKKLKDLSDIRQGVSKGRVIDVIDSIEVPYLRVANVKDGKLDLSEIKMIFVKRNEIEKYELYFQDILITEGGDSDKLGRGSIWLNEIENCIYQNHLFRIRTDKNRLSPYYLYFFLQGFTAKTYFLSCAKQTTGIASVNSSQVSATPIPLPPLPEQRAIAACLSTWDSAIQKTTQLIAQKEQRKKWLMQQLLTERRRLKGFEGAWRECHLGDVFEERVETGYNDLPLLSIGQSGIYPQAESVKKDTSNEDKSKYRRICPDDIGYNTMRMWQGRSALSQLEGIVSPAYTIVTPKKNADPLFFSYLFKTPRLMHLFWRNSQGLVDDTLNCKFKDFAIVKVHLPVKKEQTAIAHILQTADQEIQLLKAKVEKMKEQKKGMMQVLLSGRKRLKIKNLNN